jgi:hypothetical protein
MRELVGPERRGPGLPGRRGVPRLRGRARLVTPARAAGMLGMLACGFALTFVTGPTAFGLSRTDMPQLTWTDREVVLATLALPAGGNVFRLDTGPLAARLQALPAVATADVTIALPDAAVVVRIEERQPVVAWAVGDTRYIADRTGRIFAALAEAGTAASLPAGVPVIDDRRARAAAGLAVGAQLDAVDFDVATRLGSLTPADIGSTASRLAVVVTDADGYTLTVPGGWTAVFGPYSTATRPTDMIPAQVRLLRSLLLGRESTVSRIILASGTDGTYVPRATPKPTPR